VRAFEASQIQAQAAGGVQVSQIRGLRGVIEREKAEIGVLITMEPPSKPMKIEAADAGFYDSKVWGTKHPKLQILTIADLLMDKGIDYPQTQANVTFKRAPAPKAKAPKISTCRCSSRLWARCS
jgi:site-specific DNA-methyltransferase (adenine-specific)